MRIPFLYRLIATLVAIGCLSPLQAEVRIWTDIYGNARWAELVHAYGPMAYFQDAEKGFVSFRTEELIEEDQKIVEEFRESQTSHPWNESGSLISRLLRDRLHHLKDGEFVEYGFGPGPEPDFYLFCFVDSKAEESRNFTPKLVKAYEELHEIGLSNFEVILVGQGRKEAAFQDYVREMELPWPAVDWKIRKKIRAISSVKNKGRLTLVLSDQEGNVLQRAMSGKDGESPISILVALNNHLTWTNPDNIVVKRINHGKFLKEYLEEPRADSPPLPHDCSLDGIDFSAIPDNSFTIRLKVNKKGFVEDVEVLSEIPEEIKAAVMEVSSAWLFIPCIQDGQYTRSLITFPVSK